MLTALLSIVGILVGASLQYFFTRYLETQRHQRESRTQAYLDYLKSVSGLAHLNDPQGSQERDLLANAADAKARICIYGSSAVIRALASFQKRGGVLNSPEECASFVEKIAEMRKDSGGSSTASIQHLGLLLLGSHDVSQQRGRLNS